MHWRRLGRRLLRHHLPLAASSGLLVGAIFAALPAGDPSFRWSLSTAYAALALLAISLLIGPLNLLRVRPNPVSSDLRRDVGIWAAGLGLAHTFVALPMHLKGMLRRYFGASAEEPRFLPLQPDSFDFANDAGLVAALLLLLLLALSNDLSLRTLGSGRWKALQRLNYLLLLLVAGHALVYQRLERRDPVYVAIFAAVVSVVVGSQLAGIGLRWRRRSRARPRQARLEATAER